MKDNGKITKSQAMEGKSGTMEPSTRGHGKKIKATEKALSFSLMDWFMKETGLKEKQMGKEAIFMKATHNIVGIGLTTDHMGSDWKSQMMERYMKEISKKEKKKVMVK